MQTPEQLRATAKTLEELAEKLEKEKDAASGLWKPNVGDWFFSLWHDGASWHVDHLRYYGDGSHRTIDARVSIGNCYRTESDVQDVADQRSFIERCLTAGDAEFADFGYEVWVNRGILEISKFNGAGGLARKFSTEAKALAFVDSEGGEAEFVKKFSRGWV